MAKTKTKNDVAVSISAPNFVTAEFRIKGVTPYVQNKFSARKQAELHKQHEAGSVSKKGKKKEPRNFEQECEEATHRLDDGSYGMPAPGFRCAMIDACRLVGFQMTRSKLGLFVEADGFGDDATPLVKMAKGAPDYSELSVRNATGVLDLRPRPMWQPGWETALRIRFDSDMFNVTDIANLLMRAGLQVGIGEGRPGSKQSNGMGWGMFEIVGKPKTE